MFHLGGYKCLKHFYIHYILCSRKYLFPTAVSYNRFVELESRVFFVMMFFLRKSAFGRCNGVSYVDSTMIPVCHNVRRYMNKVFKGFAGDGKGTMGWCHGFKLHFVCNGQAEIIAFCLTTANTDDREPQGVECAGEGPVRQAVRGPRIYLAKALRRRHTPRHRHKVKHEEQAHAAVGQDNAAQTPCHRVRQRHAEEHRDARPLASPLHRQLHHEPCVRTRCLLLLRQQASRPFRFRGSHDKPALSFLDLSLIDGSICQTPLSRRVFLLHPAFEHFCNNFIPNSRNSSL